MTEVGAFSFKRKYRIENIFIILYNEEKAKGYCFMRRKTAGKKILTVLMAASLILSPAEMAAAAELETENAGEEFTAEESVPEIEAETSAEEMEIAMENDTGSGDDMESSDSVQPAAEAGGENTEEAAELSVDSVEEIPETAEEELQMEQEETAFDDGSADAIQGSATYADDRCTWIFDENGTLTVTGAGIELTENDEKALLGTDLDINKVNKLVIGKGIRSFNEFSIWNLRSRIKELEINGDAGMQMSSYCFDDQTKLEKVTISGAVDLPEYLFEGCTGLKTVILKNGIQTVGKGAFEECSSLESVTFENTSLKKIGVSMFEDCTSLVSVKLPDSVTEIGSYAFCRSGIRDIELPQNLVSIGEYAFCDCKNLAQIQLPLKLTTVGSGAFCDCKNLAQIQLPSKLTTVGDGAFKGCAALKKIDIPASVTKIDEDAFKETGLTAVTLHEGLKEIGGRAFCDCTGLKKIRIPKTVSRIRDFAFGIYFVNSKEKVIPGGFTVEGYKDSEAEAYVKRMSGYTDQKNNPLFKGLKFVSLGKTSTPSVASAKLTGLHDTTYAGKTVVQTEKLTYGGKTLVRNRDYTIIWKNNTKIGYATVIIKGKGSYTGTVTKCIAISPKKNGSYTVGKAKYKVLDSRINGYGRVSFTGTTDKSSRTSLTIPTTVKLGNAKFRVTEIGASAMSGAKKLTTVNIGSNINNIGAKAFYGCSRLSKVTISGTKLTTARTGANAFRGIRSNCTFKVPASKVSAYAKLLKAKGAGPRIKVTK